MDNKTPKYACPSCGYKGITQGMPECPQCHKGFNWGAPAKSEDRRDKSKNYLMTGYYWFRMLSMFFPIIGIILLFLNKDYKNNLNRMKSDTYDKFFKNVVVYTAVWVLLIVVLIVAAAMATKQAQNGA